MHLFLIYHRCDTTYPGTVSYDVHPASPYSFRRWSGPPAELLREQHSPCRITDRGWNEKKIRAGRKPSSVSPVSRGGEHLSGPLIAQRLERSTRKSRTGRPYSLAGSASLCDLAPGGVFQASPVARGPGGLLPHRFTLTLAGGLLFCGTFHGVAPCPVSGPPCPAELGLSSPRFREAITSPALNCERTEKCGRR